MLDFYCDILSVHFMECSYYLLRNLLIVLVAFKVNEIKWQCLSVANYARAYAAWLENQIQTK